MWPEENGAERSFLTDISHIPSCAMSLRQAEGLRSGERNEGLPARVVQKRERRSVSGGRSDFAQHIGISEVLAFFIFSKIS